LDAFYTSDVIGRSNGTDVVTTPSDRLQTEKLLYLKNYNWLLNYLYK
jgi:hypothetical protein